MSRMFIWYSRVVVWVFWYSRCFSAPSSDIFSTFESLSVRSWTFHKMMYSLSTPKSSLAPNEGRNNWCTSRLQDFDFETFRDFFRLWDQKSSSAKARWHCLEGRPCIFCISKLYKKNLSCWNVATTHWILNYRMIFF